MQKVLKKVCNIILDILIFIFGLILLISIYNDIQVKVLKKSYADFFGYTTFEVQTGSMTPAINVSDLIIVKKNNSPEVKDIITYQKDGEFITHRVVEAYKETYVTKGDANNAKDDAIMKDQIVGKVVKIIPHFGVIRKTILNPVVLLTLIVTVYIISLLFKKDNKKGLGKYVSKIFKEKEKKDISNTVAFKVVEQSNLEEKDIEEAKEALANLENEAEELDKTIYFRKISVDSSELNQKIPEATEEEVIEIPEEESIDEVEKKLETIKRKHKKFTSLIEKVMYIKKEELNEIALVLNDEKLKPNEATIKDIFLDKYIDGKYYNHCGNVNVDYNMRNICSKLEEVILNIGIGILKEYKGTDTKYKDKVAKYQLIFSLIMNLEHINDLYEDMDLKISAYKKKLEKYFKGESNTFINNKIKEIISIQKIYSRMISESLDKVSTNTFELKYNQLTTKKNMYGLVLEHNINFSKIYSDYIVDKTYDEGIVAEDKVLVTINILMRQIAINMLTNNLKANYLLYLPETLYDKETKLSRVIKLLDDDCMKNSLVLLVKYAELNKHKKIIREIKKLGYKIGVIYNLDSMKNKDKLSIAIADYIFIDKKLAKTFDLTTLNEDAIILENIEDKVDVSGGE